MIANTRKMREVQDIIQSILEEELILYDMFNGMVDNGEMTLAELEKMSKAAKRPNLHKSEIKTMTREEIMANPYLKNINVPNVASNNFKLSKRRIIRPGIITKLGTKKRDLATMRQVNSYFVCDKSLRFPGLVEGEKTTCWMTVEPNEIQSFEQFINEATGNVLLLGCGLGYVAYMLSRKEDVTSITVVDNNQDVLALFTTYILPQFENCEKVQTVCSDGIDYLKTADLSVFNHVNVDIWYDTIDMIYPYLRCLEIEKANPTVKFSYWLEDELQYDIQTGILIAATRADCVEGQNNATIPERSLANLPGHNFLTDKIAKDLVEETKIKSYEDLYHLVELPDFRNTLLGWYANNIDKVESNEAIDMNRLRNIHMNMTRARTVIQSDNHPKIFFK